MKPIVSRNCRVRYPEHFRVGEYSVVDDYCYFSTMVEVGRFSHIAACCTVAGGRETKFTLGDYSSVSSGARIFCKSNDFVNDLAVLLPRGVNIGDKPIAGNVSIGNMCGVGANSVIMPGNEIPDGTVVGALSFVPAEYMFKPWSVYAGSPIRLLKKRNKSRVLKQAKQLEILLSPKKVSE